MQHSLTVIFFAVALNAATATKVIAAMTAIFGLLQGIKKAIPAIQGKWALVLNIAFSVIGALIAVPPETFFSIDTAMTVLTIALGAAGIHGTWSKLSDGSTASSTVSKITTTLSVFMVCILLASCGNLHRVTTDGSTPAPPTMAEQVNYDNAQIAIHNQAIAKGIIAIQQAGLMEKEYFDVLSAGQIRITRIHQQLTPLLASPSPDNAAQIQTLIGELKTIANQMINNGTVGIKNAQSQSGIAQEIAAIATLADTITNSLTAAGLLK